jgi:hypothetical protein
MNLHIQFKSFCRSNFKEEPSLEGEDGPFGLAHKDPNDPISSSIRANKFVMLMIPDEKDISK